MSTLVIFFAAYPIYIASLYAVIHVLLRHEKRHHVTHIASVFLSGLIAFFISRTLKVFIDHPRPDLLHALFVPEDVYSFPSGHATYMFALAFALYGFDKKGGVVLFVLAAVTGLARVLAGVHYWYDIVGGLFIGAGVASVVHVALSRRVRLLK